MRAITPSGLTACGETQAAQFSRWGLARRSISAEPRRSAPLIVAFRSEYTRYSSLTRLVSRAPRPHRENWPLSALTRVPPKAVSAPHPKNAGSRCAFSPGGAMPGACPSGRFPPGADSMQRSGGAERRRGGVWGGVSPPHGKGWGESRSDSRRRPEGLAPRIRRMQGAGVLFRRVARCRGACRDPARSAAGEGCGEGFPLLSGPETWVTVRTGDMGNSCGEMAGTDREGDRCLGKREVLWN